jgi:protein-tyrosine phosphatase
MKRSSFLAGGALILSSSGTAYARARSEEIFPTPGYPGASLGLVSVSNLRDLGGYTSKNGFVVRYESIYRSNQLNPVSPEDLKKLAALGLSTDYDLRTKSERENFPDVLPSGVRNVWLDVMKDGQGDGPVQLDKLLSDPRHAGAALGDGKAEALFERGYRDFVSLQSAKAAYHQLFSDLAQPGNGPALFHCTGGKDRTGWAAASLLTLLGVSKKQVYADYLRSNQYVLPGYKKFIDAFVSKGGSPQIPIAVFGVKEAYLDASFDEVKQRYGSIENYFAKGLGIDSVAQQSLGRRFLAYV